ncbi:uncharacterized protein LOC141651599 [Silene latifolia]|uniref:uncharacterized protein LOC141651599 n=1 Tax=Silene latifolia TaxID=37657 RepID=UPI003D776961
MRIFARLNEFVLKRLRILGRQEINSLLRKQSVIWLKHGDDNTSYFHALHRRRRAKNRVFQVADVNNILCSTTESIQPLSFITIKAIVGTEKYVKPINRKVIKYGKCVIEAQCLMLSAPITAEEVKVAMFDIPGTKALVPMFSFSGPLPLCNTIYKCLSKVLCNRIGKVLPDVISPSQGAFIKGRDIVGNILICQDLIKLYKRKSCSPRVLMKVDLQKAYDSV